MKRIAMAIALVAMAFAVKAQRYKVNASASTLEWKGTKKIGEHVGVIAIKNGYIDVKDGNIEGGEFVVDMRNITVLHMDDQDDVKHILKDISSKQFFNVKDFPTAKFVISSYHNGMLTGALTIKGITNNIQFKADFDVNGEDFSANADTFSIDRQLWKLKFGNWIKENVLDDPIQFKVKIKAETTSA